MLHEQYTKELHDNFGIAFNELFTITNMPVQLPYSQYSTARTTLVSTPALLA
tara:strand:- start:235 stop:390 length:156 start_codon:yes stop_codon:yes gene_type:complete